MNILLTSVGRRAYMVKYFKQALGNAGMVHACNSDDLTVAFQYADKSFVSPLIYDENYIPVLLKYCRENQIDILLSLFDIDLPVLAANRAEFEKIGTKVIVSDGSFVNICNDKWKTFLFLKSHGFRVPKTYLTLSSLWTALEQGEVHYPIIVKPRFGCGSIALSVAEDKKELVHYSEKKIKEISKTYLKYESQKEPEKIIYQEKLVGQEYGVDIINDLKGTFQNAIVKKKIAMRSGETDIAEIVNNKAIYETASRLGKVTGHIANLDCDFFLINRIPYILEMNARFGGGYPFSHAGGCNLPLAIVRWCWGEEVSRDLLSVQKYIRAYKEMELTIEK